MEKVWFEARGEVTWVPLEEDEQIPIRLILGQGGGGDLVKLNGGLIELDACGNSIRTWGQLKPHLGPGSQERPISVAIQVLWDVKVLLSRQIFQHLSVKEDSLLRKHVRDFSSAFALKKWGRTYRFDASGDLLGQAAAFWSNDLLPCLYTNRIRLLLTRKATELKQVLRNVLDWAAEKADEGVVFGAAMAVEDREIIPIVAFPRTKKAVQGAKVKKIANGIENRAFKELAFQVFAAARLELSSSRTGDKLEKGCYCTLDGITFKILDVLSVCSHYMGGVYLVEQQQADKNQLAVLKRGPTRWAREVALSLGLYGPDWKQVETELEARKLLLAANVEPRIPRLWYKGELQLQDSTSSPAFVSSFEGHTLGGKTSLLPMEEVVDMGMSLVTTVALLWQAGITHGDINPKNVARNGDKYGQDRFCLLDLGAATWKKCSEEKLKYPVVDLVYGPMVLVLNGFNIPTACSECESVLFTMLELAGFKLPWRDAAELDDVRNSRRVVMQSDGVLLASVCPTPASLPSIFHLLEQLLYGSISFRDLLEKLSIST